MLAYVVACEGVSVAERLLELQKYGPCRWGEIAKEIKGRPRNSKSCRLRWCNQLNPAVKKGPFSDLEDAVIVTAHKVAPMSHRSTGLSNCTLQSSLIPAEK